MQLKRKLELKKTVQSTGKIQFQLSRHCLSVNTLQELITRIVKFICDQETKKLVFDTSSRQISLETTSILSAWPSDSDLLAKVVSLAFMNQASKLSECITRQHQKEYSLLVSRKSFNVNFNLVGSHLENDKIRNPLVKKLALL